MSEPIRIMFVCLGNIVRSPLAEHMFRHLAEEAGLGEKYLVDSAGTSAYHVGDSPDRRMRRVAAQNGLEYTGRAKQFERGDFDQFDLVIAMDSDNRENLLHLTSSPERQAKVRMMREFDSMGGPTAPVPDPYYGGIGGFEEVYGIVERSCRGLLEALERGEV